MAQSRRAERLAQKEEERRLQEIQSEIERKQCLNCDQPLEPTMKFCHNCGQKNVDRRVPIKDLLGEFSRDYLTFDSKFFSSFIPLLFRPGHLTKEFTNGKRVSFIPPIRLYIFISIVYFFAVSFETSVNDIQVNNTITDSTGQVLKTNGLSITLDPESREALGEDNFFVKKINSIATMSQNEKRQMVNRAISILMFLLMPYLAMLLGLFYRKKKRYYVEHLIFSFHFHSFYFLLQLIALIATWLVDGFPYGTVVLLITAVYFYFALLKMYENKWGLNLIKFFGLIVVYLCGMIVLMGIGFFVSIMMS